MEHAMTFLASSGTCLFKELSSPVQLYSHMSALSHMVCHSCLHFAFVEFTKKQKVLVALSL